MTHFDQTLQHIRNALDTGDAENAIESIFRALVPFSFTRSRLELEDENFPGAIYQATLFLLLAEKYAPEKQEDRGTAYSLRGKAYYYYEDFKNAISDLTHAKMLLENTTAAEQVDIDIYRGNAHLKLGDLETAIAIFQEALQITPENSTLLYNLATACTQMGDSLQTSQSRLDTSPQETDPETWYQAAIETFTEAIGIEENADLYYNRGYAHFKVEQYEEAETDFSQAITLNGGEARFHFNRAMARSRLGRRDAEDDFVYYQSLLGKLPENEELL